MAGVGECAEAWLIRGDWGWERLLGFAVDEFAKVEGPTSVVSVGYFSQSWGFWCFGKILLFEVSHLYKVLVTAARGVFMDEGDISPFDS